MQKIALITDSACDLDLDTLKENNINLLPLRIIYSTGDYRDRLDISPNEVYENLYKEVPKTSLPSAEDIEQILNKLESEGYTHVICISISSGLSGSYNALRLALEDHPKLTSFVYDSKILAYPQGEIVIEVAKLIKAGKSFEEIIEEIPSIRERVIGYFTINTLEYLKKGGRISSTKAALGSLLNIKPILTVNDGLVVQKSQVRGKKQIFTNLVNSVIEKYGDDLTNKTVILGCGDNNEDLETLRETLLKNAKVKNVYDVNIGCVICSHSGPGVVGISCI